jgi:HlyD family secretion protein
MQTAGRKWVTLALVAAVAAGAGAAWWKLRLPPLPPGLAMANGRIEATQIDIATKLAGRIREILVAEADFVEAGQVLARMDVQTLEAELAQAQAQVRHAQSSKITAASVVEQRRSARVTALAVVAQRESELAFAQKEFQRSEALVVKGFISAQKLDDSRAKLEGAHAAFSAARSQVIEADSAIAAATSQVVEAQSTIEAAMATVERLRSEIGDATLKAPRAGRVQYKLAEAGEVLAAGGKVISMLDLADVYMTVFLPETTAGKLAIGAEARLVLDAAPQYVIPAKITFVAAEAQFTPKTVETAAERQKLVFRVKAQIDPDLLRKYQTRVKAGLPGVAYVRVDPGAAWPPALEIRLPPQ